MFKNFLRHPLQNKDGDTGSGKADKDNKSDLSPWAAPATVTEQSAGKGKDDDREGDKNRGSSLAEFVKGLDLTGGVDVEAIQKGMEDGDLSPLRAALDTVAEKTFTAAMLNANRIMERRFEALKEETTSTTRATMRSDEALRQLQAKLPIAKDELFEPVARTVLGGFLRKDGATVEGAINKTLQYFDKMAETQGWQTRPPQDDKRPGGRLPSVPPGRSTDNKDDDDDEAPSWAAILTGGPVPNDEP